MFENDTKYACLLQRGDTPLHIAIRFRDKKVSELLLRNPKDGRLLYKPNRDGDTPYNIDCNHQKGILTQIFGASKLNIFVWILCGMIDRGKWLWLWGESVDCKKRWDVYICLPMWSIYILFLRLFYQKVSEQIFYFEKWYSMSFPLSDWQLPVLFIWGNYEWLLCQICHIFLNWKRVRIMRENFELELTIICILLGRVGKTPLGSPSCTNVTRQKHQCLDYNICN